MARREQRLLRLLQSPQVRRVRLHDPIIPQDRKGQLSPFAAVLGQLVRTLVPRQAERDRVGEPRLGVRDGLVEDLKAFDGGSEGSDDTGYRFLTCGEERGEGC